ncbi:MAG: hypothetical protein ACUVWX_08155 [Kiritimatiellia bacterium]
MSLPRVYGRLLFVLSAAMLFSACEKDEEPVQQPPDPFTASGVNILGTWVDTNDGNETLTFLADGAWSWVDEPGRGREWRATASGSWQIEGDTILIRGVDHYGQEFSATATVLSNNRLHISRWIELDWHEETFVR